MKTRVQFCTSCSQYPAEARLARTLEQMGWELTLDFDEGATPGVFAVYLNDDMIFPSESHGKLPGPTDNAPGIPTRLFGDPA
jgi:predicted Rdx family selenoprotein